MSVSFSVCKFSQLSVFCYIINGRLVEDPSGKLKAEVMNICPDVMKISKNTNTVISSHALLVSVVSVTLIDCNNCHTAMHSQQTICNTGIKLLCKVKMIIPIILILSCDQRKITYFLSFLHLGSKNLITKKKKNSDGDKGNMLPMLSSSHMLVVGWST